MAKDKKVSVGELNQKWVAHLKLSKVSGKAGFDAFITAAPVRKPGLRMTEKPMKLDSGHIYVLGETECAYIEKLSPKERENLAGDFARQGIPCFIVSDGININARFKSMMNKKSIAVFKSDIPLEALMSTLGELLEWRLAPFTTFHATLVVVHGTGTLITGKSGVGKSECALDLIERGWKFVSDDIVEIKRVGAHLLGAPPETVRHMMEIRGIGIVNIGDLFGRTSVMESHSIDMVINIELWDSKREYDRLGLETKTIKILDVELPIANIPVRPGRSIATLVEVAVRNHILKTDGENTFDSLPKMVARRKNAKRRDA
ncbi:HPr(Ser) kinase/phosphatase [Candidatus Mycalebacterium sp.]